MIKLSDKWVITSGPSSHDFCVTQIKQGYNTKEEKATVREVKTFHPSLESCAAKITRQNVLDEIDETGEELRSINDLIKEIKKMQDELLEGIQNVGKE